MSIPWTREVAWYRRWVSIISACLRWFLPCGLVLLTCTACATTKAKPPEAETSLPLPDVRQVSFTGNAHFSSRTLRGEMASKPRPFWAPWRRGEPYNPPTVEADLQRLKKFYFDRGFLDTTVSLADVQLDPEAQRVSLTIAIDEGSPTQVAAVHLTGTIPPELPPAQEILKPLPLRPGERLTKADFDRSKDLLLLRLRDASYARAEVVPQTEVDPEAHTAVVTFDLRPGARTTFGRITIEGEQQVKEQAIRRQLTIQEGQLYSQKELTASADAIYELGMFQAVTPRMLNPEEDGAPLDLAIEVRERKPHTLQFGVGFSTVELFRLQAQWMYRNLWQEADRLTLSGKFSSNEQTFETRFQMPYFLAPRTTFTQTVFVRNEQQVGAGTVGLADLSVAKAQPAFDLFKVGGESRVGHKFTQTLQGFGGLELSLNKFRNVDPTALAEAGAAAAEDNFLFVQFGELERNTTDNRLNPTQGMLLRGKVSHASTVLLSDVSFLKLSLEGRHFQPLWAKIVLATRLEVGGIQPYGGRDTVPFNVRFFAGGPGSVRGFALNRLGPLDSKGDPIGGQSLLVGTIELRFPIIGDLGGAAFFDFGNVYRDPFSYQLGDLRYAAGPGIRYMTPIGPIRFDVGFIVNRRPADRFGRIDFSIGQAF